jgi:hypothetical protein
MTRRINLIFPDGTITTGRTYREVEDALRAAQWNAYGSRREFRREMRRRADLWSGRRGKPVVAQTAKQFIYHLVHSGMCMIEIINYPDNPAEGS